MPLRLARPALAWLGSLALAVAFLLAPGLGHAQKAPAADKPAATKPAGDAKPAAKPALVDLNTASQADLEKLLGVGPVKAQAIIAGRPYAKIEDIMKVRGIKEKTFAKIKDYIVVK